MTAVQKNRKFRLSCGRVARLEQVRAGVGAHRPVVVLARAVDAREGLLVQQAHEAVAARDRLQHLHRQVLVVGADVGVLEDRRDLVLRRRDLVVARLDRHAELGELVLGLEHAREHPLGDRAEVVVVELVALGRLGAEERAPGREQVGPLEVVLLVDQEVLLLGPDRREHALGLLVAEQLQRPDRRLRERVHRAQQRDLVVERLARPRRERRRDAEQRPVGVLEDEGRAGRVPRGVAAGLEGRADAAGREAGGVRLALDELLARELGDRRPVAHRRVEGVVLLGRGAGQRLEPVREVRRAVLERPLLHRERDGVRQRGVDRLAASEGRLQALEDVLGQALALLVDGEDVGAEHLVAGGGQVDGAHGAAVRAPLRRAEVLLAGPGHGCWLPPGGERGRAWTHARAGRCMAAYGESREGGLYACLKIRAFLSPGGRNNANPAWTGCPTDWRNGGPDLSTRVQRPVRRPPAHSRSCIPNEEDV